MRRRFTTGKSLSNIACVRVLSNPRQRRFFKTNDIHDLFMLNGESSSEPLARLKSRSKSASKRFSRACSALPGATNLVDRSDMHEKREREDAFQAC